MNGKVQHVVTTDVTCIFMCESEREREREKGKSYVLLICEIILNAYETIFKILILYALNVPEISCLISFSDTCVGLLTSRGPGKIFFAMQVGKHN